MKIELFEIRQVAKFANLFVDGQCVGRIELTKGGEELLLKLIEAMDKLEGGK
jgi:hypothetical protein